MPLTSDGMPRPDHGPGWRDRLCRACGASWVGHERDGEEWCPWCEQAAERQLRRRAPAAARPAVVAVGRGQPALRRAVGDRQGRVGPHPWADPGRGLGGVVGGTVAAGGGCGGRHQRRGRTGPSEGSLDEPHLRPAARRVRRRRHQHRRRARRHLHRLAAVLDPGPHRPRLAGGADPPGQALGRHVRPRRGRQVAAGPVDRRRAGHGPADLRRRAGTDRRAVPGLGDDRGRPRSSASTRWATDPTTICRTCTTPSQPPLPPLDGHAGGDEVVRRAAACGAELVVIDTFSRAVDGDENDADTVRAWYRWTGQRLKAAGRAFLRIDHAGKDQTRGQRGTSAKNDDVDIVWHLTVLDDDMVRLKALKKRMEWVPEIVELRRSSDDLTYSILVGMVGWKAGTHDVAEAARQPRAACGYHQARRRGEASGGRSQRRQRRVGRRRQVPQTAGLDGRGPRRGPHLSTGYGPDRRT